MECNTVGVGFLDEGEDAFLDESVKVAQSFLTLFQDARSQYTTKSPNPPHQAPKAAQDLDAFAPHPTSVAVAEKLKMIGDSIQSKLDDELTAILVKQSVMQMGLEQFTRTCRIVLANCSGTINNGWQQVYTVYYSMTRTVQELRQQPNLPDQARRQRETHIQQFVGPAMQDLGLEAWIQAQGGLVRRRCLYEIRTRKRTIMILLFMGNTGLAMTTFEVPSPKVMNAHFFSLQNNLPIADVSTSSKVPVSGTSV